MTLDELIIEKLKDYVDGTTPFKKFWSWIAENTWSRETELVYRIKLVIFEYTSGHRSERELKNILSEEIKF